MDAIQEEKLHTSFGVRKQNIMTQITVEQVNMATQPVRFAVSRGIVAEMQTRMQIVWRVMQRLKQEILVT